LRQSPSGWLDHVASHPVDVVGSHERDPDARPSMVMRVFALIGFNRDFQHQSGVNLQVDGNLRRSLD
jgi:hypothetical protein